MNYAQLDSRIMLLKELLYLKEKDLTFACSLDLMVNDHCIVPKDGCVIGAYHKAQTFNAFKN